MKIDTHYNDFGGLDTRSNDLMQNPKCVRRLSRNFRYTFKDEIAKRYGFQQKTEATSKCDWGLFEYKYKDINTGESKTEILGINEAGFLSKRMSIYLKMTFVSSTVSYYSFYYDGTTYKIEFLNSLYVSIGSVDVSTTMTLTQLKTAINALAITGLTADVVDNDFSPTTSALPAYLIDVVYQEEIASTGTDIEYNPVYYWETIDTPDRAYNTNGSAPFAEITSDSLKDLASYEGPTWINAHNSIYITAGGFVYKYDGATVYKAGMPDLSRFTGFNIFTAGLGGDLGTGAYQYGLQLGATDNNGVQILSKAFLQSASGSTSYGIPISADQNGHGNYQFPIYACVVNGTQTVTTSITVDAGHNIKAGMYLRIHLAYTIDPVTPAPEQGVLHLYKLVTAVTSTTITLSTSLGGYPVNPLDITDSTGLAIGKLFDNTVINACYGPDYLTDLEIYNQTDGNTFTPSPVYGAFLRINRSIENQLNYYHCYDAPVPISTANEYSFSEGLADALLSRVDMIEGECQPRTCRYLTKWQNQLIQSGRPYIDVIGEDYPNFIKGSIPAITGGPFDFSEYQENDTCDFQSVYWADPVQIEGFAQSGLSEESFDSEFSDEIRGMGVNKEALFVFKQRTTAYLTGVLATGDLVKEFLEQDVGCAAHKTIQSVNGALIFMDQDSGFWSVIAGRLPEFIGYPIMDYFKLNDQQTRANKLVLRRAVSQNYKLQDIYLCYIPSGIKEDDETMVFPDSGPASIIFAYDYSVTNDGKTLRNCWYPWGSLNAAGGILATSNDELFLSQKSVIQNIMYKQKSTGSIYDYSDHISSVDFEYRGSFLHYGRPTIDKHFVQIIVNSVAGGFDLTINQWGNYLQTLIGTIDVSFPDSSSKLVVKEKIKASIPKLSSISIGFENLIINQDVRINGWEIQYNDDFDSSEVKR